MWGIGLTFSQMAPENRILRLNFDRVIQKNGNTDFFKERAQFFGA